MHRPAARRPGRLVIATGRVEVEELGDIADPPSPRDIRDAIRCFATDPDVRTRLNGIRDELHNVGGPGHAADAVEDVAAGRW